MNDQELELAILQRYVEHHDTVGSQAQKCARELDMKDVISAAIGRPADDTVVKRWHSRLAPPSPCPPGVLRPCSDSTVNNGPHRFHARAYFEPGKTPAWDRIAELRSQLPAQLMAEKEKERKSKILYRAKTPIAVPDNPWDEIQKEYGVNKKSFGKRMSFVSDPFMRKIIFRDIQQAYVLATSEFSKPAVILAGSIIEELLRQYLKYKKIKPAKDTFEGYIEACKNHDLLKTAIHGLTDSVRHFRNLVHLAKERSPKHTISIATAKGAISSIFTVVNDFEK